MTRTWTPKELEELEAGIKEARAGNVGAAASLLHLAAVCLEREWPLPEPLRHYLIAAFFEITNVTGRVPPPYPTPKNLAELRKDLQYLEELRDANVALNLKRPRGRKSSSIRVLTESSYINIAVTEAMEKGGRSVEAAVGAVADKMGISDRTVARARKFMKQRYPPSPKVDDSK